MSVLDEPYYCSEQISVPPELPNILKEFTKAAIRTQPSDLIKWSAAYFRALSRNEIPPIGNRFKFDQSPPRKYEEPKLTQQLLSIINKQLGPKKIVPLAQIEEKWKDLSMPMDNYQEIVNVGQFEGDVEWYKFFGLACSALGKDLEDSIRIIGEILCEEPSGESRIPYTLFKHYFEYLAKNDGMPVNDIDNILQRIFYAVEKEDGMVDASNFRNISES